jgi:hypothetical protein
MTKKDNRVIVRGRFATPKDVEKAYATMTNATPAEMRAKAKAEWQKIKAEILAETIVTGRFATPEDVLDAFRSQLSKKEIRKYQKMLKEWVNDEARRFSELKAQTKPKRKPRPSRNP